jgi:hypothetical protein
MIWNSPNDNIKPNQDKEQEQKGALFIYKLLRWEENNTAQILISVFILTFITISVILISVFIYNMSTYIFAQKHLMMVLWERNISYTVTVYILK